MPYVSIPSTRVVADTHAHAQARCYSTPPTTSTLVVHYRFLDRLLHPRHPSHSCTMSDQQDHNAAAGPSSGQPEETQPLLAPGDPQKEEALRAYKKALKSHEEMSEGLKRSECLSNRARKRQCLTLCPHTPHSEIRIEGLGKGIRQDRRQYEGFAICWADHWRGIEAAGRREM